MTGGRDQIFATHGPSTGWGRRADFRRIRKLFFEAAMSDRNQALGKRRRNVGSASDLRSVTADELAAMAVTADELAAMALTADDFAAMTLTAEDLAAMGGVPSTEGLPTLADVAAREQIEGKRRRLSRKRDAVESQ
jgi:hypothetical protein